MIQVLGSAGQILRWGQPGELAKVVYEMGLIVISATERDIGPIDLLFTMDGRQNFLEALHPAERLRRQTHLFMKNLDEAALA